MPSLVYCNECFVDRLPDLCIFVFSNFDVIICAKFCIHTVILICRIFCFLLLTNQVIDKLPVGCV